MYRFSRILAIVLLAVTVSFTLLGGVGTTCVAFKAEKFGASMAKLVPVKSIFQALVIISIAAALFGAYTTYRLVRGKREAFNWALAFLGLAGTASAVQFYYSLTLRGSTAPNNIRLYITVVTMIVFLILRIPGIWRRTGFEQAEENRGVGLPGGLALMGCGLLILSVPVWGAPTHMIDGINTVNVLLLPLTGVGLALFMGGLALWVGIRSYQPEKAVPVQG